MPASLFSFTIEDADNKQTTLPIYFDATGVTVADLQDWVTAHAPDVDGVTEGQITRARVTLELELPGGLKGAPVAGSNIQEGALFQMDVADSSYNFGIWVPAYLQSQFVGTVVNIALTPTSNFLTALLVGDLGIIPTDRYLNILDHVLKAVKRFRKFRQQEVRG